MVSHTNTALACMKGVELGLQPPPYGKGVQLADSVTSMKSFFQRAYDLPTLWKGGGATLQS